MSPLYPINDWSDVNLYFSIGKSIFRGKILYSEIFDHKGPLIFFIYGIGSFISSDSFLGMYIIQSMTWTLMVCAAYVIARIYFGKMYAFIIALAYPLFLLSHSSEGGSAEEFIVACITVSLTFYLIYFKDGTPTLHKPLYMFVHGIMFSIALFIKMNLVVFWIFPILAIFINLVWCKEYKNLIQNILAFGGGVLTVTLPLLFYFYFNNAIADAWNTYIILNKNYAKLGSISEILELLIVRFYQRLKFDNIEFLIILIGTLYFPVKYIKNNLGRLGIIFSFVSLYIVIFMSPNYVYYYSVPYYVYSILGCIVIVGFLAKYIEMKSVWYFYFLFSVVALAWGIYNKDFFTMSKKEILRQEHCDCVQYKFGEIIIKEKNPTLVCLALDETNVIFTMVDIYPNVKYFISPNLPYNIYPDMRDQQTKYIENKEVQFITLAQHSLNYEYFKNLPVLENNYNVAATFQKDNGSIYYLYKRK